MTKRFAWDDLCKILRGDQRMARIQNGIETFPKILTGSVGARTLQTDDRKICDSKYPNVTWSRSGKTWHMHIIYLFAQSTSDIAVI